MLWSLMSSCSNSKKDRASNKRGRGRYTTTHQFVTSHLEQGYGHVWASGMRACLGVWVGTTAGMMRLDKRNSKKELLGLSRSGERCLKGENAEHQCSHNNNMKLYGIQVVSSLKLDQREQWYGLVKGLVYFFKYHRSARNCCN